MKYIWYKNPYEIPSHTEPPFEGEWHLVNQSNMADHNWEAVFAYTYGQFRSLWAVFTKDEECIPFLSISYKFWVL